MVEQIELNINQIELLENNPRKIDAKELETLCIDIQADPTFLIQRPPLINLVNGVYQCYAGSQRIKACRQLGYTAIKCFVENDVPKELQDKRMILDNTHRGEWDIDLLMQFDFTVEELKGMGIETEVFNDLFIADENQVERDAARKSLQERFIVSPFSVLDTRQGVWQERKRHWHNMGINSQESREDVELIAPSGQSSGIYELRNKMRDKLGREPEWPEIIDQAKAMGLHIYEGASIFDPVLTEVCYKWFCPQGGSILDPFAGGSVRGIVAGVLGFNYKGIDLRPEQVEANIKQLQELNINDCGNVDWLTGDSNIILDSETEQYDFVFSCPPYFDLEKYSKDPADLSNMDYAEFCKIYRSIIAKAMSKLKQDRFACFVVGDIRDKKGFYRNFVTETIDCFTKCIDENGNQAKLYNEIILVNVAGSLAIRVGRQFSAGRKVGKMHQNVLVFYKGDPKKIKQNFPEIEIENIEEK